MGWWGIGVVELMGDSPADQVAHHLPALRRHHGIEAEGEVDVPRATLLPLLQDFTAGVVADVRNDYATVLPGRELVGFRCELKSTAFDVEPAARPSKPMLELFRGLGMCWKDSGVDRWPTARELCDAFDFVARPVLRCGGEEISRLVPIVTFSGPRLTLEQTAASLVLALRRCEIDVATVRIRDAARVVSVEAEVVTPFEHDASDELADAIHDLRRGDRAELLTILLCERPERFPEIVQLELG